MPLPSLPVARRILRAVKWLFLGGLTAFILLIGGLLIEDAREISLPLPSGPFTVGRLIDDWADPATIDPLSPAPGTTRELLVWIWYPAASTGATPFDDYLPAAMRPEPETSDARNPWTYLTRDPSLVRGNSRKAAEVAPGGPFPIVLLRAGASSGVLNYSSLAEDLASHGFVVVGFDAPYRTGLVRFPDGRSFGRRAENNPESCLGRPPAEQERCASRILDAWIGDMSFVLDRLQALNESTRQDRFRGRLDLARVGAFGHSFGGAAVAEFCRRDPRCRAGVDIDGAPHGAVIQAGLKQPFLLLLSDHSAEAGPDTARITADVQSLYDHLPPDTRMWVDIPGSFHFMFSDDGVVRKSAIVRGVLRVLGRLRIDARRQLAATSYCLCSFFAAHLNSPAGTRPAIPSTLFPEVRLVR
jgi:pimeloyl-ACP methyl ester carboxylesterase